MAKNYFELLLEKELIEMTDNTGNVNELQEPSKDTIDFILNYSKSLSVNQNDKLGPIFLNLN